MTGPLPYIGGKNRLANQIIRLFPKHSTYVEGFAGGAQVFFHKPASPVEVLNDLDGDIVNFFRVCQRHHEELLRYLRFMLVSRQWFARIETENPETLTDIERAGRFLYLQKCAYAGLVRNRRYRCFVAQPPGFNPATLPEILDNTHKRLERVQIESLPYQEIIRHFDRPTTLFYFDPPYYGLRLYRHNLAHEDFVAMAEVLKRMKGKFVLSINDAEEIRNIFGKFKSREITLHYTSQRKAGKRFTELLITNF